MKELSIRWVSFLAGCAAAGAALVAGTAQIPAVLPLHHLHVAWTLTRILIEF